MKARSTLFSSQSVDWPTPAALYASLDKEFSFDLDPCPLGGGAPDGLATLLCSWSGRRVFCNPPYGPRIAGFIERAREAAVAVYLLPARTDTRWFHDLVLPSASEIRFIRGRLKFGDAAHGAPFPSMVVVYRNE
ncbi:MAG: DNA N-6-adenine-methyltransferase [Acidobacteriaceae bacterium]